MLSAPLPRAMKFSHPAPGGSRSGSRWRSPKKNPCATRSAETVADGVWHGSQTSGKEPGGTLVLALHTGGLEELARRLLSFGDEASVPEPPAMRDAVFARCRRVLARCDG